jgi:hypothetical protein
LLRPNSDIWTESGGFIPGGDLPLGGLRGTRGRLHVDPDPDLYFEDYSYENQIIASESGAGDSHAGWSSVTLIKGISQGGRWAAEFNHDEEWGGWLNLPYRSWSYSAINTIGNRHIRLQESEREFSDTVNIRGYIVAAINDSGISVGSNDDGGVIWGPDGMIRRRLAGFVPMDINDNGDILGWQDGVFSMIHEGNVYSFQSLLANQQMPGAITWQTSYFDTAGRFLVNGYLFEPVPEPSGLTVIGVGLLLLRRKRR